MLSLTEFPPDSYCVTVQKIDEACRNQHTVIYQSQLTVLRP